MTPIVTSLPQTGQLPPCASVVGGSQHDAACPVAVQVVLALLREELDRAAVRPRIAASLARRRWPHTRVRCRRASPHVPASPANARRSSRPACSGRAARRASSSAGRKRDRSPPRRCAASGRRSTRRRESKPDFEPSSENQGVQMCAGIRWHAGSTSSTVSSRSRESSPRIGRPSERMLPIFSSRACSAATASRLGREDDVVDLARAIDPSAPLFVDVADLAAEHEADRPLAGSRHRSLYVPRVLVLQAIQPVFRVKVRACHASPAASQGARCRPCRRRERP